MDLVMKLFILQGRHEKLNDFITFVYYFCSLWEDL